MSHELRRELVEHPDYTKQLETLGGIARADEVLAGLHESIAVKPSAHPVVHTSGIQMAKTSHIFSDFGITPVTRVWFYVRDEDHVDLLLG